MSLHKKIIVILIFFGISLSFLQKTSVRRMVPYTSKSYRKKHFRRTYGSSFRRQYQKEKEKFIKNWMKNFLYGGVGIAGFTYINEQLKKRMNLSKV